VRAANLLEKPKPAIRREEIFTRNGGALRGERGQRAGKVEVGSLGDPCHRFRAERDKACAESIRRVLGGRGAGEAHGSDEIPAKPVRSEGALAGAERTQNEPGLIG